MLGILGKHNHCASAVVELEGQKFIVKKESNNTFFKDVLEAFLGKTEEYETVKMRRFNFFPLSWIPVCVWSKRVKCEVKNIPTVRQKILALTINRYAAILYSSVAILGAYNLYSQALDVHAISAKLLEENRVRLEEETLKHVAAQKAAEAAQKAAEQSQDALTAKIASMSEDLFQCPIDQNKIAAETISVTPSRLPFIRDICLRAIGISIPIGVLYSQKIISAGMSFRENVKKQGIKQLCTEKFSQFNQSLRSLPSLLKNKK